MLIYWRVPFYDSGLQSHFSPFESSWRFGFFGFRQGISGGRGGLCALSCPDAGFQGGLHFSKQNLAALKKELLEMGLSKNMHLNPISADC